MRKNYSLVLLAIVFTVNAMAQNIPSYMPKDGLVGYWPFNGNANDESGNGNNGTVSGATLTADRNGKANSSYSFDGVSNFITINNNILNNKIPTSFAISLWVDFDTTKQCEIISNRYGQDCGYNYRLLKLDNKLIFGNHIANPWTWDSCSTELNTTSEWNQITFMYDLNDKRLKLYLNGKFVGANNSNIWFDGNNPTIIGALLGCGQGSFYSKGTFDDIAIYNRVLTQQEITALYTEKPVAQNIPSYVPKDGLVGYWPFNGNANDESGNGNNGTVNGATLTSDRNGVANSAYSFDGVSNYLSGNCSIFPDNERTISMWLNSSFIQDKTYFIGYGGGNCGSSFGIYGNFSGCTTEGINSFGYSSHCCNNNFNKPYNSNIINKWNNLVIITKKDTTRLFLNGELIHTTNININITDVKNKNFIFGGLVNINGIGIFPGTFYNGQLDDIAIYNRALTEQEITALYTEKPVAQNIPSYVPKNGLVGYWPFNGNANDESGNGNNGTVNGATIATDRNGVANSAYSFIQTQNIQNIAINLPKSVSPDASAEYGYSFWMNSINSSIGRVFQHTGMNKTAFDFVRSEITKPIDSYSFWHYNVSSQKTSPDKLIQNKWYHIVILIKSNGLVDLYRDGQYWFSGNYSSSKPDEGVFMLGSQSNSLVGFTGQLDDIAIYSRALSQQEITALYSGSTNLASTKVFVDAPASVNQNDTLELSISTETLNSTDNVIAFQTDITYDTTRYTFVSNHTVGTLNPKGSVDLNTDKKGTIKVGYISTSALQGAGSLLKLKFKANQQVGQGIFGLSKFIYNNTDITSLKNDTVITLDVTPPSASISLSQNPVRKGDSLLITVKFSETMTDKPAPQVSLAGANTLASTNLTKVNDFTYTYWWVVEKGNGAVNVEITSAQDLAGNNLVKPTVNTSFTVLPTLFGDIDTNKIIRAYDAALALQYSVGLNPLPTMDPLPWSNWRIAVANVDTVGTITANDAALIVKHSIGKITSFPADAKKRGDAPLANITVTQEANQLVFRATGTLYAFNVFMKDNFNAFGQPEVKDKNAMIATNITSTTYNVGLASTTPFTENEPFLVIPIVTNENVQGTMDIVANAQEKALAYGTAASIATNQNEAMVIYPNPTKDVVTINNAQGKTVKIVDVQGKEVYNAVLPNTKTEISLKALGAKGMYVVHILDANNLPVQTKQIVLE